MKHGTAVKAHERAGPTRIWLALLAATALTAWLVEGGAHAAGVATTGSVLACGFKARLVALHYMELRSAPAVSRWLFEGWIFGCVLMVLAGYWLA